MTRDLTRRALVLGSPVGAGIASYYGLWGPVDGESRTFAVVSNLLLFLVFAAAFAVLYRPRAVRMVGAAISAVEEDPSAANAATLARLPLRLAFSMFKAMTAVAVVTTVLNLASSRDPRPAS